MRAFVAVVPPPPVLSPLCRVVDGLRGAHHASWVPPERLHVTLAFLGDVTDAKAARVADRLRRDAAAREPFVLRLRGGGAFPKAARARVLWAGLAGEVDALADLAGTVRTERTAYVPHVTVARLRAPSDVTDAVAALSALESDEWTVGEVVLMRSHLGPAPSYEPVARCPLGYQA